MLFNTPQLLVPRRNSAAASYSFTNSEASTLVAAMSVQPDVTRKGVIDTLVGALKTAGVWSKLDVLYVLAAHDAQAARLNWKAPASFALSEVSSPTFTTDRGYAGNGSSSYLSTGWVPSTDAVQYTQLAGHVAIWDRTSRAAGGTVEIGSTDGASSIYVLPRFTGNLYFGAVNQGGESVANSTSSGFFHVNRSNSNAVQFYRNGSSLGTGNQATGARNNKAVYIGAYNNNGTPGSFSTDQIAEASLGASLNSTEAADYYNALATYMTAVGA